MWIDKINVDTKKVFTFIFLLKYIWKEKRKCQELEKDQTDIGQRMKN